MLLGEVIMRQFTIFVYIYLYNKDISEYAQILVANGNYIYDS